MPGCGQFELASFQAVVDQREHRDGEHNPYAERPQHSLGVWLVTKQEVQAREETPDHRDEQDEDDGFQHGVGLYRMTSDEGSNAARGFRPGWRMTGFVVVMLPVLVSLGLWQLDRADEKRVLEDRYVDALGERPRPAESASLDDLPAFARVRVTGRYLSEQQYLIDHQIFQGEVGYWVVSPMVDQDNRAWLINRGFIAAPQRREVLPALPVPDGEVSVVAVLWPDLGLPPAFEEVDPARLAEQAYPRRVQRLDVDLLARLESAVPAQLRLEGGQPGSLTPASLAVDFNPARHTGYAVQWFALAATLLIGYVVLGLRNGADPQQ